MKTVSTVLLSFVLVGSLWAAEPAAKPQSAAPASEASVKELLRITDARKVLDTMMVQVETAMRTGVQHALQGKQMTPAMQRAVEKNQQKTIAVLKEELSWDKLESLYVQIYQESFTQQELNAILAFYRTPAGQAMIQKMPEVMAKAGTAMQARLGPMLEKLQQAQKEMAAEVEAAEADKPKTD